MCVLGSVRKFERNTLKEEKDFWIMAHFAGVWKSKTFARTNLHKNKFYYIKKKKNTKKTMHEIVQDSFALKKYLKNRAPIISCLHLSSSS